jgi:hypothetical protein
MELSQLTELLGEIDPIQEENAPAIVFVSKVIEEKKIAKNATSSCGLI